MRLYCTQTRPDSEQRRQTQSLACESSTLQIHVTLQPSPDYLTPFYGSCFQKRVTMADLTPESNLCSRDRRYSGREHRDCLSMSCNVFKTPQHYSHSLLATGQYLQSLIKYGFDQTMRDKGSKPLGMGGGGTSSRLHS